MRCARAHRFERQRRQKSGRNRTKIVINSSLPRIIQKLSTTFPDVGMKAKLCVGTTAASPGPMLNRVAVTDVFAETMPQYWEGGQGVILVYDVTRAHTLEACGHWYGRLLEALQVESLPGAVVANKVDLRERLVVQRAQGQQMAASLSMQYFETSALDVRPGHF